jgi:hypothetical protein
MVAARRVERMRSFIVRRRRFLVERFLDGSEDCFFG